MRMMFALLAALMLAASAMGCNHFGNWHSTRGDMVAGCSSCASGGSMPELQAVSSTVEPPLMDE